MLLDAKLLAAKLSVSVTKARQMIAAEAVPVVQFGRQKRVPEAALESWILSETRYPAPREEAQGDGLDLADVEGLGSAARARRRRRPARAQTQGNEAPAAPMGNGHRLAEAAGLGKRQAVDRLSELLG